MGDRIAVIFPGVGYHADKPLLYYSGKLAKEQGYEVIKLSFHDLPQNIFSSQDQRVEAFGLAMDQAEEALGAVDFSTFKDILFISKSIGTGVAAGYAARHEIRARNVYYTPLLETMELMRPESGIVFHGTNDPWEQDTEGVKFICDGLKLPLHLVKGGNHSLETGNTGSDLPVLTAVMAETQKFIIGEK